MTPRRCIRRQGLLVVSSRLQLHTALVHVVQLLGGLQAFHDIVLQFRDGLQEVRRVLELLDVLEDVGDLGPFAEVDHSVGGMVGDAVFDEDEVG